jgi:hypothetical protein
MTDSRPWWASDGPVDGGVDPAEDPLVAHRTARRGPEPEPEPAPPTDDTTSPGPGTGATPGHTQPGSEICGVCPVCIAARMLGETRPELLAHLTEAGRHLSAALRTLIETSTDRSNGARGSEPDDRGVRRIDLDR